MHGSAWVQGVCGSLRPIHAVLLLLGSRREGGKRGKLVNGAGEGDSTEMKGALSCDLLRSNSLLHTLSQVLGGTQQVPL